MIVRLPIALVVAGVDLVMAFADAALIVVGAVVTAVTDIVSAAIPAPRQPAETLTAAREEQQTLPQAIAQAPVTISRGFTDAGAALQRGVRKAGTDFRDTLTGRPAQERALVSAGDNEVLRTPAIAGDDDTTGARAEVVRPSRPRPVLGAAKAVTGTLKAVRDGARTALGLPRRNPGPAPQNADEGVANADAPTGS